MNAPAAFKATYSDLRFVKSRKVAQVMLELPIEQADAFVKAFGTPNPASETWVAIARLDPDKTKEPVKERRSFDELPLSQQAALLCNREAFWRFLDEVAVNEGAAMPPINCETDAANDIRERCKISSRSELDTNARAAKYFRLLQDKFNSWLKEPVL